jgi:hypothetical protein
MLGFSWYNSGLVLEYITADWEAYPIGHGWETALENLSWFNPETKFYKIDDICRSLLFVAKDPIELRKRKLNPHSSIYYHISIWHEDLIELHKLGLVSGIKPLTEYQYELLRFKYMTDDMGIWVDENNMYHFPNGTQCEGIPRPQEGDWDDDYDFWVDIPDGYIQLTPLGIEKINEPIKDFYINDEIAERIMPLFEIKYYDSAVREASIMLELKLIALNNSSQIGQKLVDEHYKNLCEKFGGEDSYLRYYRGLLRCSVNFIRNEYAHAFPITNENRAKRLIGLYSKLYDLTDELRNE